MSNYGRGKRRYNNGYNGYHRSRFASPHYHDQQTTNDNGNKPFRILQRKQGDTNNSTNVHNTNVSSNNPSTNTINNSPSRFNNTEHKNNTNTTDNVAAVLQNVISDVAPNTSSHPQKVSNLGHQLLGMQRRGGRLYHYKRKDGTGSVIPIPQHHKKNYNKSIGRGKKFDKEREAALQALAQQQNPDAATKDEASAIKPTETDISNIPILSESILSDNAAPGLIKVQQQTDDTPPIPNIINSSLNDDTRDTRDTREIRDTRSWRRNRFRGRVRGRGRRSKHYGKYYYGRNSRSTHSDRWSDDDDYNREKGYGNKHNNRWDKRRSKFEPPRHRHSTSPWDKDRHTDGNTAFGTSIMESLNESTLQSPNIGPRHRHYNKKFNKLHRQLTESPSLQKGDKKGDEWDDETILDLEADVLSSYLSCYDGNGANRDRVCKSWPFLDVRMCAHVLNEIEEELTDCSDFLVIGVIGQQGVGKSTILSHLAAGNAKEDIFLGSELSKLISSTHTTHGIQCYITDERIIYLDCQPILSPSILFSLTNHRRRCMREKSHESIISPMETWDIEMAKHSLFLCCICHIMLVVSDSMADIETANFLRSIYCLRQSMKINSFLRHDSSLRKKLKDLQTAINEKYDKKKSSALSNYKSDEAPSIRPQHLRREWRRYERSKEKEKEEEEEAVWSGTDKSVEEDYKLFKLLNAQQRYGFPDIIFIQNKVATFDMTPSTFNGQREFLYTMFKHQYITREGEIGNSDLLGMYTTANEVSCKIPYKENDTIASDEESDNCDDYKENMQEMASKMNCFFLPRVQSSKREFEVLCCELRNQIVSMAKPQTISQSHSYKQTERDWFSFAKKIWHVLSNAPNFIEYRGNHNHSTT